jgi:hypothetical protein
MFNGFMFNGFMFNGFMFNGFMFNGFIVFKKGSKNVAGCATGQTSRLKSVYHFIVSHALTLMMIPISMKATVNPFFACFWGTFEWNCINERLQKEEQQEYVSQTFASTAWWDGSSIPTAVNNQVADNRVLLHRTL